MCFGSVSSWMELRTTRARKKQTKLIVKIVILIEFGGLIVLRLWECGFLHGEMLTWVVFCSWSNTSEVATLINLEPESASCGSKSRCFILRSCITLAKIAIYTCGTIPFLFWNTASSCTQLCVFNYKCLPHLTSLICCSRWHIVATFVQLAGFGPKRIQ